MGREGRASCHRHRQHARGLQDGVLASDDDIIASSTIELHCGEPDHGLTENALQQAVEEVIALVRQLEDSGIAVRLRVRTW